MIMITMQDLVPQQLLEFYCSMADPAKVQTVDPEITRHCAYNLPAVAFTLGRHNWPCISDLYEAMTSDVQVSRMFFLNGKVYFLQPNTAGN